MSNTVTLEELLADARDVALNGTSEEKANFVAYVSEGIRYTSYQNDRENLALWEAMYREYLSVLSKKN